MSLASIDRYARGRVGRVGEHAVVVGASVAGLLAARVLADAFDRVTILDRDALGPTTLERRGVPQGRHVHVLLAAGQAVMEDLVPGLTDDLDAAGALLIDLNREFAVHAADGFIAAGTDEIPMYFASRPLIEQLLRARVAAHERVTLRPDCQVAGCLVADDGGTVRGVAVVQNGGRERIPAELVVDAAGRAARTTSWIEELGHPTPATETVKVDLAYATCELRRPAADRLAMLIMPSAPRARGAAVFPVEGDRWLITFTGMHGDHPPGDLSGLREFAARLPTPAVRGLLDAHEPVSSEVARYRYPANVRRRYDRLPAHPPGLLAIGDAVATFNPVYGQGMTVAALQALALHHALAEHGTEELAADFYRRAGAVVDVAWSLAAGGDFQFPETEGDKPRGADLLNRYVTRLHRKAQADGHLAEAFNRVVVMEQPPTSLFRPQVAWRVLRPGSPAR